MKQLARSYFRNVGWLSTDLALICQTIVLFITITVRTVFPRIGNFLCSPFLLLFQLMQILYRYFDAALLLNRELGNWEKLPSKSL
jgi:hypothetical protein